MRILVAAAALLLALAAPSGAAVDTSTHYAAIRPTDKPIIVLVHGGGWEFGTSEQTRPWAELLQRQGYPVVNASYRLACATPDVYRVALIPEPSVAPACSTSDKLILDVARQVRSARARHAALGTTSRHVILVGFSAGGQLATLLAARGIGDGVVGFSAPTNMTRASSPLAPYAEAFVGCARAACPEKWRALSASSYRTTAPMFLAYGQNEAMVPPGSQGDPMHHADANARIVRVQGAQHTTAAITGSWERPLLTKGLAYVTDRLSQE